tara:strand:- start:501 stop:1067 length:567 start_codon:yes stop_codon:yes gene_type:complete
MKIVNVSDDIISRLRCSDISTKMRSLESCEWLVLEEENGKILGAAGMGGVFHVSGIQIHENAQGKGIGKKIQKELIEESQRKKYSFITVFNDPRNASSVHLHDSLGYEKIFRIHYSEDIVNDVKAISFNKKGDLMIRLLRFFNSKLGMITLAFSLKILKMFFPKLIIYNEDDLPSPDIRWIINNFEKV